MRRKDSSLDYSYPRSPSLPDTHQSFPQKNYSEAVIELLGAVSKKLQNKSIQIAEDKPPLPTKKSSIKPSFLFETPLLDFKELVCYLKDTGGRFEEKTLWQILKTTIYGCAAMEDCFLCFDDFDINCFGVFQNEEGFAVKIKHIFKEGNSCFDVVEKLDGLISGLPPEWRREEIVFDSVNRTTLLRREIDKRNNPFLSFLSAFNQKIKKSVRSVFGLILRISIYEFDRDNNNKMRILKSRLLTLLRERGYSELFVGFTIGVLFTKDVNSLSSFCELRNRMETGGFDSKGSFDSFSSQKPNFSDKGIKQLKWTKDQLSSNFSFLVNNCLSTNQSVKGKCIEVKKKENSPSGPKRLLKNKSSDESFNYQSYLNRVVDQHPEISEIMQNKRIDNIMQGSDEDCTLNSLASYLRKGEFSRPEHKQTIKIRSNFNKQKHNDTLNLTLNNERLEKKESLEESNKSDIEVSGLQKTHNQERTDYKQLISNFDDELRVDEELDSINKRITNLKLRIQKHKKELTKNNKGDKKLLTNITDFGNNKNNSKRLNITENRILLGSPKQVRHIKYQRLTSFSREDGGKKIGRTRTLSITRGNVENRYTNFKVPETNKNKQHKEVFSTSFGNSGFHKRSISSNEQRLGRFGRNTSISEKRIQRGDSRSTSSKRRIKLESVGTDFFKELVSKDRRQESYDNYYLN